ncbi:MAG: GNAT family N-acetyltransferase [Lentimicrobium sp.]|jgi:RimJ/RimL family protein N-acetyltransferase|nr:N-acetyltransferase [Bacteroidales bacterium]
MQSFTLRKWQLSDLESLMKHADNRKIADRLTDKFPHPYTRESGEGFLKMAMEKDPPSVFAIDVDGEAVGCIGIFPQDDIHRLNAEMGYWLSESYWGRGIMTAAICRMVDYGFKTFDISRIYARPFGSNPASQRVLGKAGFSLEARFEKVLIKNGELLDEVVYGIRRVTHKL